MSNNKKDSDNQILYLPLGMSIGLSVGMAIGAALGNIPIGMCIGLSVGMCVGAMIDSTNQKKTEDPSESDEKEA